MLERIVNGIRPLQVGATVYLLVPAAFFSEDITCIGAGLLVANEAAPYASVIAACFTGILAANLTLYGIGRILGLAVFERVPLKWICRRADIERYARWFNRNGASVIYITRCIPGTRFPTCVAAGMLRFPFMMFTFYQALALMLWVPALVGLASLAGEAILPLLAGFRRYALPVALMLAALLLAIAKGIVPLAARRGRRLVRARWLRLTGWMFWPQWLFHAPLVVYIGGLRLRYRAWTCTLCNPAIPISGFAGLSKTHVLGLLRDGGAPVAICARIDHTLAADDRVREAERFLHSQKLTYPVVLKPDIGNNGRGVRIVRTPGELERFLARDRPVDLMLQEYVPGSEFEAFLVQAQAGGQARIFSFARSKPLSVTGDGQRTLDELILDNPDAACRYRMLAQRFRNRLRDIPDTGREVHLSEQGSFQHGAVFEDARPLATPAIKTQLQQLLTHVPGIHFVRLNIRLCPDGDGQTGARFRITGVNGLTAIATHLYRRGTGPLEAWRTLAQQWRMAFDIGAGQAASGMRPWSLQDILRSYSASREQQP